MNPVSPLRRIAMGLAILGAAIASYLTWAKLTDSSVFCTSLGGCDIVQQSRYAEVAGIPVALIGLVGYGAILGCLLFEERLESAAPYLVFGLSLVGALYSSYLTYLEVFVIHAICPYCVVSAALMLALLAIAIYRLTADPAQGDLSAANDVHQ